MSLPKNINDDVFPAYSKQAARHVWLLNVWFWAAFLLPVVVCCVIREMSERWWPATVMMFGPRWIWGLPLLGFIPVLLLLSRGSAGQWRRWLAVLAGLTVWLGQLMGLELHFTPSNAPKPQTLRIVTCNFHGHVVNDQLFARFLDQAQPDVVLMQEYLEAHPIHKLWGKPPFVAIDGELRIESRWPIHKVSQAIHTNLQCGGIAVRYQIDSPFGPVPICNVHLASPHEAMTDAIHRLSGRALQKNSAIRRQQAQAISSAVRPIIADVILAGDFNLPTDSPIFERNFANLDDAFATTGLGFGWTYRAHGILSRIDHVLYGSNWRCLTCWAGPDVGSPHRPLVADLSR